MTASGQDFTLYQGERRTVVFGYDPAAFDPTGATARLTLNLARQRQIQTLDSTPVLAAGEWTVTFEFMRSTTASLGPGNYGFLLALIIGGEMRVVATGALTILANPTPVT